MSKMFRLRIVTKSQFQMVLSFSTEKQIYRIIHELITELFTKLIILEKYYLGNIPLLTSSVTNATPLGET